MSKESENYVKFQELIAKSELNKTGIAECFKMRAKLSQKFRIYKNSDRTLIGSDSLQSDLKRDLGELCESMASKTNYLADSVMMTCKKFAKNEPITTNWETSDCGRLLVESLLKESRSETNQTGFVTLKKNSEFFKTKPVTSTFFTKKPKLEPAYQDVNRKEFANKVPDDNIEFKSAKHVYMETLDKNDPKRAELSEKRLGSCNRSVKSTKNEKTETQHEVIDEDGPLKNIEKRMVELIESEIMDCKRSSTTWDDLIGLDFAKSTIQETIIWPILRPDIFCGLRKPPRGLLLFGPPGTGKTMIGKCIASESGSTFFSISSSTLTSKYIGEGEKMVRALFAVAKLHQPSVIFIDEIDSLLCQRSDTENESSRRIKTEFLVQIDGVSKRFEEDDKILLIGATNRPHEIDEAARRRFVKRLYIPLPSSQARQDIVRRLIEHEKHCLADKDYDEIGEKTSGFSGADMKSLCSEASLCPIRDIRLSSIRDISASEVRPISLQDFLDAIRHVKPSVSDNMLKFYSDWNNEFGSFPIKT